MIAHTNPSGIVPNTMYAPRRLAYSRRQAGGLGVSPSFSSRAGGWEEQQVEFQKEEHEAVRDTRGGATRSNLPQNLFGHMELPPRHVNRMRLQL